MKVNQYSCGVIENQHSPSPFSGVTEIARRSAVLILRVESLLLAILALVQCYFGLTKDVTALGALLGTIAFSIIGSIGLYFCSRGFEKFQSWGRAPGLLANLIALGVSYFMLSGHYWMALPLGALAFAGTFATLLGYRD